MDNETDIVARLKNGKPKLTADEINQLYGFDVKTYRASVKNFKEKPEYNVHIQNEMKMNFENEIIGLKDEIETLEKSRDRYKEKYHTLLDKLRRIGDGLE